MIDNEILQDYAGEARELLDEMDQSLIRLEKEGESPELLNTIFRAAHCIKGSAEYIGLERTSALTHGIETLLDRMRTGVIAVRPAIVDFLFRAKDLLSALLEDVLLSQEEKADISRTMKDLGELLAPGPQAAAAPAGEAAWPEVPFGEALDAIDEGMPPMGEDELLGLGGDSFPEIESEPSLEAEGPPPPRDFPGRAPTFDLSADVPADTNELEEFVADLDDIIGAKAPTVELEAPSLGPSPTEEPWARDSEMAAEEPLFQAVERETPTVGMLTPTMEESTPDELDELDAEAIRPPARKPRPGAEAPAPPTGAAAIPTPASQPPGAEPSPRAAEKRPSSAQAVELEAGAIEETAPDVLNLALHIDDLEDGVAYGELRSSIMGTISALKESLDLLGVDAAVDLLERMEKRFDSLQATRGRVSPGILKEFRSYLENLQSFYPPDTFPSEEPTLPEPEVTPTEEVSPIPAAPHLRELQTIPGVDREVLGAIHGAGFASIEQLASTTVETLAGVPGVSHDLAVTILKAVQKVPDERKKELRKARPGARSLMEDVDEDLLREFEGIDVEEEITLEERPTVLLEAPAAAPVKDLTGQLAEIGEETDRELVDIFLSYGWEISDKVRPVVEKIRKREVKRTDLESCAEAIKSIRSSASYMDYRKLVAFLDEWYDKVAWASERAEALSAQDLHFVEEKLTAFQSFLKALAASTTGTKPTAAKIQEAPPARPAKPASPPRPAAAPKPRPPEPAPAKKPVKPEPKQPFERPGPRPSTPPAPPDKPEAKRPAEPAPRPPEKPLRPVPEGAAVAPQPAPEPEIIVDAPRKPREVAPPEAAAPPTHDAEAADAREETPEGPVVRTMRVEAGKVDVLLNQVGELVVNRSYIEQLSSELKNFLRELSAAKEVGKKEIQSLKDLSLRVSEASLSLGRAATELQEGVMKLRMLPVGQLFNRMPRLIRDLSRRVGKKVALEVLGGDTEVDKRVIEQIYNPLVHLIRNSVDHGIEETERRLADGKSEEGTIRLNAYSQGNLVVIDVEDDGGGIDHDEVLAKAVEMGLVDQREIPELSTTEVYSYLFAPGFSTSKKVTRTSGRGVGMDVVKKDVEKINGEVEIDSVKGEGTRISIKIPLTLAIIQTLLIRFGKYTFAIPLTSVREIIQIAPKEISTIEGFEVVKFREETIPVLRLNEVFQVSNFEHKQEPRFLVLATAGVRTIGLPVEDLIGEQDVVIKPLAEHVWKTRGLAGSTILGDGTIALVLDVAELLDDVMAKLRQIALAGTRDAQAAYANGSQNNLQT